MEVIVITGASDGIGAEMARQLARSRGKDVALVLAARKVEQLQSVADACTALGALALVVPTDVCDQSQCRHLIAAAAERSGASMHWSIMPGVRRMRCSRTCRTWAGMRT
jgi:NADP-dependent 3-hydroxy acid dehydrogenase YdfG